MTTEDASVYDLIRAKIVRNEIPPGEKITIDSLVQELGVSQTPVREALHHLEGDGLVERAKGRGYSTTALLDETEFRHMFEVRMLLEPWSARVLSVDRMTNPGDRLGRLVDDFRGAGATTRTELAAHDEEFHALVQRSTGNAFLASAFGSLHAQLHLFRLYGDDIEGTQMLSDHADATLEEHAAIAAAISSCRPGAAEEAMRLHLANSLERFVPQIEGRTSGRPGLDRVPTGRILPADRTGAADPTGATGRTGAAQETGPAAES